MNSKKRKHNAEDRSESKVCASEMEKQCLLLLIEIYKNNHENANTRDILPQILTKHGCNLFMASESSTTKPEIIKRIVTEVLGETEDEESDTIAVEDEEELAHEVEKILKEDSSLSTLQQKIQTCNQEIFCKSNGESTESTENGEAIIEMLSRFLIMLTEESVLGKAIMENVERTNEMQTHESAEENLFDRATTENVENTNETPSPRTPSHEENEIQSPLRTSHEEISLTQPFLQFFDLFTKGNETEWTHQLPITNVILHHYLRNRNSNNFEFGTYVVNTLF
jgi:hypothetical protein